MELGNLNMIFLIFARTAAVFAGTPFFGGRSIPPVVRIWFTLALSAFLLPVLPLEVEVPQTVGLYVGAIIHEVLIGAIIGFIVHLFFSVLHMAGTFVDLVIGFRMAEVIDPTSGAQTGLVGQFYYMLAVLVLLYTDGHHWILMALAESFRIVPPVLARTELSGALAEGMITLFGQLVVIAVRIAFPVAGAIFVVDVFSGIMARAVPQINIFILGFPAKIALGILAIILTLPYFADIVRTLIGRMGNDLYEAISVLGTS